MGRLSHKKPRPVGVIFDMDGVIFNTQKLIFKSERLLFKEMKLKIPIREHCSYAGQTSHELWTILKQKHNLKPLVSTLVLKHRIFGFEYIKARELQLIDGVMNLIKILHKNKVKMAIATSGWKPRVDWMLGNVEGIKGLRLFFSAVVYGDDVQNSKPAPDIFLQAAEQLNISFKRCVVIEDSRNGIHAAKNAGMIAIGFKAPKSRQNLDNADFVYNSFKQIAGIDLKKVALRTSIGSEAPIYIPPNPLIRHTQGHPTYE